jgi:hypothetical protein
MGDKAGYRDDGSRIRRPDNARNTPPRAVAIRYGGRSALRRARLDRRTGEAKFELALIAERVAHLGGESEVTEPMLSIVRHSARLELLLALAHAEVVRSGVLDAKGELSGAVDAFLSIGKELREALKVIGLERRAKQVPSLADYLAGRDHAEGKQQTGEALT